MASPYARYLSQYKLGRWDGKAGSLGLGGNGYVNHLDKILQIIHEEGIEVDSLMTKDKKDLNFSLIDKDYFVDKNVPKDIQKVNQRIMRLPEGRTNFLRNPKFTRGALGAGKTIDHCLFVKFM